jgi:hypothetical protein
VSRGEALEGPGSELPKFGAGRWAQCGAGPAGRRPRYIYGILYTISAGETQEEFLDTSSITAFRCFDSRDGNLGKFTAEDAVPAGYPPNCGGVWLGERNIRLNRDCKSTKMSADIILW